MSSSKPTITLYTSQSPNGVKISILLEELGLPYEVRKIDMQATEQKSAWFAEINPNGRIPALTDTLEDGTAIRIFESGSIMQYLIDRYDTEHKLGYPRGSKEFIETNSWLFFQNAGIGPMQGQANHFLRYAKEPNEYASKRYQDEMKRLYAVLDKHLADAKTDYLVGDKCTIADIAHWGWICLSRWSYVELSEFPALQTWEERMLARPAVEKGRHVPDPHHREILMDAAKMEEFEKKARGFYREQEAKGWAPKSDE